MKVGGCEHGTEAKEMERRWRNCDRVFGSSYEREREREKTRY